MDGTWGAWIDAYICCALDVGADLEDLLEALFGAFGAIAGGLIQGLRKWCIGMRAAGIDPAICRFLDTAKSPTIADLLHFLRGNCSGVLT
jgi:hypothetical protein